MNPTPVFDAYWRFAAERQEMFWRRYEDLPPPWTHDTILNTYRFTNAYRASDRVSQYLIREVQYRPDLPRDPEQIFFRTLLFKIFNKIDTWEHLEGTLGPLEWKKTDLNDIDNLLAKLTLQGARIYSAAYIMPAPRLGYTRKHTNHLALLSRMMSDGLPRKVACATNLRSIFDKLCKYPGVGPFLSFQYTIDLNYSDLVNFSESDFVVAGPGAKEGIRRCFYDVKKYDPEEIIFYMTERQHAEFSRLGLRFRSLFGRPLQPIDCQNIFCEIAKYARVAFPTLAQRGGRTRIKQKYHGSSRPLPSLFYPPKWGLPSVPRDARATQLE